MRTLLQTLFLAICLLGLVGGCDPEPTKPRYDPIDWTDIPVEEGKPKPPPPPQKEEEVSAVLQTLLRLHNQEREMKGRAGLQLDPYLCKYAQDHADWMAKRSNLKHSDIGKLMGKYHTAGENIAWNQQSEEQVVRDWMNSSGHRANIMNRNFTKVGFGVAYNARGEPYWCTVFGG